MKSTTAAFALVGLLLATPAVTAGPPITALAFSNDGRFVLAGSQAGVRIFAWPQLTLVGTLPTDIPHVHAISFSPEGSRFAVGGGRPSEYGELEVFSWPDKTRMASNVQHDDVIYGLDWLTENRCVTASADESVVLWNVDPASIDRQHRYDGHSRRVRAVVAMPDVQLLVSAGLDQSLRVWKMARPQLVRVLDNHTDVVHDLAKRPATGGLPQLASCSRDRTVRIWQPTIGRLVRFIKLSREPLAIAWSRQGKLLAAACVDGTVRWIDPETVSELGALQLTEGGIRELHAAPEDDTFVVGLPDGSLRQVHYSPANRGSK